MNTRNGEVLLILGFILFIAVVLASFTGHLSEDLIPIVAALALVFVIVGVTIQKTS